MTTLVLTSPAEVAAAVGSVVTVTVTVSDDTVPVFRSSDGYKLSAKKNVQTGAWSAQWVTLKAGTYAITVNAGDATPVSASVVVGGGGGGPEPDPEVVLSDEAVAVLLNLTDSATRAAARTLVAADVANPATAIGGALSATFVSTIAEPPSGDATRASRDTALRSWLDQLTSAAIPRVLIEGNSIVAGSGASDQPHTFAQLTKAAIERRYPAAVVTIDGHAGWTTTQIKNNTTPGVLVANPHGLVILGPLLANDGTAAGPTISSATTKTNLQQIVTTYQNANAGPPPSILIVTEWERNDTLTEPYQNYVNAAKEVAAANPGVAVLDLSQRIGRVADDELSLFADAVHPNDKGHALTARLVIAEVMASETSKQVYPDHTLVTSLNPPLAKTGTWTRTAVAGSLLYANGLIYSGAVQNDDISYGFLGEKGTYSIVLAHQVRADAGKYDVYLDGVLQGAGGSFDGYAASTGFAQTEVAGFTIPTSGKHIIKLKLATKNASSSGYIGSISAIGITRTGA